MRLTIALAAAAATLFAAAAPAQTEVDPEFTPERFRAHVTYLADDLLEGRRAGERGYDLGALYVASRFEALGLKPAAASSWYQQVPLLEYKMAEAPATLTIAGKSFTHGKEVLLSPIPIETRQTLEAPVVFVGYGLDAPEQKIDDYAGLDVKNKVVAYLSGTPSGLPSDVAAHLNSQKARMAERHGAVGMIMIQTLATAKQATWTRMVQSAGRGSVSWIGPDGQPFRGAPGIGFQAVLDTPAAEALFAGAPRSLAAILKEADRKGARPKGFGLRQTAAFDQQSEVRRFDSANVVALLPGSDPALADQYVLLMAHLDHIGTDPNREGDQVNNGAMDNATGVATLLEVARAMATAPERQRRPILFAAVTAEESGLLGSQYLARNPLVNGKVVGVVNLDMPVLLYDFQDVIAFGAEHSTLGPIVARAAARMNVTLAPDPLPQEGLFTRSDHYMFVREGVPAVFLMTGFGGEGAQRFGEFLGTHYHKPSDQLDLPFDWKAAAKFARLNHLIAREIADSDTQPFWYSDSFFGRQLAPNAEKAPRPR